LEANVMISVEVVHDKTSAVAIRHERDSSAPSVASGLSSSVFHREHRCNSQAWN